MALLSTISFFHSTANAMALPIVPLYVLSLGATELVLGVVIAAAEFLPMLLAISAGAFTDRAGPKLPLQIGAATLLVGSTLRVLATDIPLLIVGQVVMGFSNLVGFLAAQSYISVISAPGEHATLFGSWSFVTSFGQTIGPLLGGLMANYFSRSGLDPATGYRSVFAMTVGFSVLTLVAGWMLPRVAGREEIRLSPLHTFRSAGRLLAQPPVAMGAWASMAMMLNAGIRRSFFPVYAAVRLGLSPGSIGLLMSVYAAASMAVRPFLGWLTREWGTVRALSFSLLLGAIAWALVPLVGSGAEVFLLLLVAGAGVGVGSPLTMVLTVEGVPPYERGLGLGIRQGANRVADFISPPLYGAVAALVGLTSTFFVAAGFALIGLGGMLRIGGRPAPAPPAAAGAAEPAGIEREDV